MSPILLEGVTLGNRQQHYNSLVNRVIQNKIPFETVLSESGNSDIDQLFVIDIASIYRNVEYITDMLKSEDMLYVSRTINKCSWLITENKYAHIINSQYLHEELFPHMTSKAIFKLLLHIRLYLNDTNRADDFYTHYERIDHNIAVKWLPNCSFDIINKSLNKYKDPPTIKIFKKLCKKFPKVFEIFANLFDPHCIQFHLEAVQFLLNTNTTAFLDIIEKLHIEYWPKFNKKSTATIMKICPERIYNKFPEYCQKIDIETVAKQIQADQIKKIIFNIADKNKLKELNFNDHIGPFIKYMPKEGKFEFSRDFYINVTYSNDNEYQPVNVLKDSSTLYDIMIYYKHAPFDLAFIELQQRIKTQSSLQEHTTIMKTMLNAAGLDINNILLVMQYYYQNHINDRFEYKMNFINYLLTVTKYPHLFHVEIWKLLNELFYSCGVYMESNNNVQHSVDVILVYNILHQQPIPEIIQKKFKFNSLNKIRSKLNDNEKSLVFSYLLNYIEIKINNLSTDTLSDINKLVSYLIGGMELLLDWKKNLANYPTLLDKIKQLALLKHQNKFDVDLNNIYNKNKSWKKIMFQECLLLSKTEKVYINVLKHDPSLLYKYPKQVEAVQFDDNVDLRQFLSKLKIYWKQSLAQEWAKAYRNRVHKSKNDNNHKALTLGLCGVMPQKELLKLFHQLAPTDSQKSRSKTVDSNLISLRKSFAGLMHNARPHPPVQSILEYAHGKYLHFALRSLNEVFHHKSVYNFKHSLPELLMGSVTSQKCAVKIALKKIKFEGLLDLFNNIWKTENSPLRIVVFQLTINLLITKKSKIVQLAHILEIFIENMTEEEYPEIFDLVKQVKDISIDLQIELIKKIYLRLKSLPLSNNRENHIQNCIRSISELIDNIDNEFVENTLLEIMQNLNSRNIFNDTCLYLMINYLLCAPESDQGRRCNKIMKPWLIKVFSCWNDMYDECSRVSYKFQRWILVLIEKIKSVFLNKNHYANPTEVIKMIIKEMKTKQPIESTYYAMTLCKLLVIFIESYNNIKSILPDKDNNESDYKLLNRDYNMWCKIAPSFAVGVVDLLKNDTEKLFPNLWTIFGKCVWEILYVMNYISQGFRYKLEDELLKNEDSPRLAGLLAVELSTSPIPWHMSDSNYTFIELRKLKEIILKHPCREVRMQFLCST